MSHVSENHLEKDLTLMLLYLTSWEEKEYGETYRRSWKGYDFDLLNELGDEELISGSNRAKSVYLSEKGTEVAKRLLKNYGMSDQENRR
ncbi:MAG: DUF6429 family protein [Sporolactobacillus sp.]